MKKTYLLSILFLMVTLSLWGQYPRGGGRYGGGFGGGFGGFGKRASGTIIEKKQQDFMSMHREGIRTFDDSTSRGISEFPVKIHIVSEASGAGATEISEIKAAIKNLNTYFLKAYIRFIPLEDYSYIKRDELYKVKVEEENELCKEYDVDKVINLYVVKSIKGERNSFKAKTYMPSNLPIDRIVIEQKSLDDKVTLVRQMCHYFSLYPTSGPNLGMRSEERVDGSNCATTGDEICDTPADPGLTLQTVDSRCEFIGSQQDGDSKFYRPMTTNIMADNPREECLRKLTRQQYQRIMYAAMYIRNYLEFPVPQELTKKYLKSLEEKYGQEGSIVFKLSGQKAGIVLNKNLYKVTGKPSAGTPYEIEITNKRKGYIYVFEGDDVRGMKKLYPLEGDQQFFKDEKKTISVPSKGKLKVDDQPGANYICVMFSKKQINVEKFLKEVNNASNKLSIFQRFYAAQEDKIVASKNIEFGNSKIEFNAVSTERFLVPIFIEYEQN